MLKNEEIRQKYPFLRKGLNDFEVEWITCGCICKVRKREWKDVRLCGSWVPKTYYSRPNQVAITLSYLARMLQTYPDSHSYFISIHKSTVILNRFCWKFSERTLFKTLRHLQSFLVAFNKQVQNIENTKASFGEDRISKNLLWQT